MEKTGDVTTMNSAFSSALPQQENAEANGYGARIAFLPLPINLKVGSAWVEFSENGSSSKYTTFIVREVNENIATIDFNGTTSIEGLIELQGVNLRQKVFGRYYGEQKVDVNSGVIQFHSSTTDVSGLIAARGQDLPVTVKIVSTTSVKNL